MELGNLETSYADLNQALRISPKYVNALHNRGLLHARADQLSDAVLDFTEAMMIDPQNPKYYQQRSEVYVSLGKTEEASADLRMLDWLVRLQELNRNLAAKPRNATAWANRARHFWDRGDEAHAKPDLAKALELDAHCGTALVLQGRIALREKRYEEALNICKPALETDDAAAAASVRGDAFLALKKYDEALESFVAAKRFDSAVAEAYFWKSEELVSRGETEAAEEQLKLAVDLDPDVERRLR
jgi:tetratricopeptide (TPR) repeat protein